MKVPGLISLYTSMAASAVEEGNEASKEFFSERFERGRHDTADASPPTSARAGSGRTSTRGWWPVC